MIGTPTTLVISGVVVVLGSMAFGSQLPEHRKQVHPAYANPGILPAVSSGLEAASGLNVRPED